MTDRDATPPADDPFAMPQASPRGAGAIAVLGIVLGVAATVTLVPMVLGPLGMVCGLVAHVKGSRAGMPAAVIAGVGTVAGMTLWFLLR